MSSFSAEETAAAIPPGLDPSATPAPSFCEPRPPSIAVVMTVYNMARYLFRAVLSVLWQLEPQDELIVVDDASSDLDGYAGLGPFLDRITWLRNPVNLGLPASRNRAIRSTKAEWIKFLDADDVLAPYALAVVRGAKPPIPPQVQVMAGGCHRIIDNTYHDFLYSDDESIREVLFRNILLPSAVFVRRSALLEVGLFDERLRFEEDWDMWLRLHERYGFQAFANTPIPFCYYWISEADSGKKERCTSVDGIPIREYFRRRYGATPWE
jgi:glycosyltransferase involved in cell wall biosynthesis